TSSATRITYGVTPSSGAAETATIANAAGNLSTIDFNSAGDIIKITTPTLTGASGPTVVSFSYDANRQVTGTTTNGVSDGSVTYNSLGLPTQAVNQLGNAWNWSYLGADLLTSQDPVQAGSGTHETLTYGDVNQPHVPTGYTDANNFAWSFVHNIYGQTT